MNKQNKLTDTANSIVVTRGKEGWWEVEKGKRGQIYGDGGRLEFGWWAHNAR